MGLPKLSRSCAYRRASSKAARATPSARQATWMRPISRPFGDQQDADPPVGGPRRRIGLAQQRDHLGLPSVGDPGLGAVDEVTVILAAGGRGDRLEIRAAARL